MIRYLTPVPARRAQGKVSQIYRQIDQDFLLGEPLTLHSPIPDLLAAVWSTFREVFVAGQADRSLKEAVAVAVSRSNQCPFCLDAHAMALRATSAQGKIGELRNPGFDGIEDPGLRAAAAWAEAVSQNGTEPVPPPVSPEELPELIGALFWMHYINRMVNLFIGESLIPLSTNRLGIRTLVERIGGRYFRRTFRLGAPSGKSLPFLAPARNGNPFDLGWAAASPVLSRSFSALVETVESEAEASLQEEVKTWFAQITHAETDLQVGMNRSWLDLPLSDLGPTLRPAGRLLLLTFQAPYQAIPSDIESFRNDYPEERQLLAACAWAALTAARRIASRAAL